MCGTLSQQFALGKGAPTVTCLWADKAQSPSPTLQGRETAHGLLRTLKTRVQILLRSREVPWPARYSEKKSRHGLIMGGTSGAKLFPRPAALPTPAPPGEPLLSVGGPAAGPRRVHIQNRCWDSAGHRFSLCKSFMESTT